MEANLVENWLRKDPTRWIAGALAGLFAALVAMSLAMVLASNAGFEAVFPIKLIGATVLGNVSTDVDFMQGALAGSVVLGVVSMILGIAFGHFVYTNSLASLLAMGVVWGIFSWIFIWNLFMQSFKAIFAAQVPATVIFPICIAFGLALSSVALFDRLIRRK